MNIIDVIEKENQRKDAPKVNVGDTVKVFYKIVEGDKHRLQAFEGVVIAKKNGGIRETFTVRRISYGVGVERTFPIHSPLIDRVELVRKGSPRRAKLYYVRNLVGKAAKIRAKEFNYVVGNEEKTENEEVVSEDLAKKTETDTDSKETK